MLDGYWYSVQDGDPRAAALYERHYSCVNIKKRRRTGDKRICGPGEHLILMTQDCTALFVWKRCNKPDLAGQSGVYCSIFRNEGQILSSQLILEAEQYARRRWPGERFYTYIDPQGIRSINPGACFKKAGWRRVRGFQTTKGKIVLEKSD